MASLPAWKQRLLNQEAEQKRKQEEELKARQLKLAELGLKERPALPSKAGVPPSATLSATNATAPTAAPAATTPSAGESAAAQPKTKAGRKSSFTFWQERDKEAQELQSKAERDKKFGEIGRDTYAALLKTSFQVASLSSSRQSSARAPASSSSSSSGGGVAARVSNGVFGAVVPRRSDRTSGSAAGGDMRASLVGRADELESLLDTMVSDAVDQALEQPDALPIYDNSDPFAFKMAPPPMVSLTGEYANIKEDAEIEAMLASVGIHDVDLSYEVEMPQHAVEHVKARAATPPPPAEAQIAANLRDAMQFWRDCRSDPAAAAATLQTRRRAKHDGANLEFTFEGELAHMKTKEGTAATDGAIAELKKAATLPALVVSQKLCDACSSAYKTKQSGQTTDALEAARLVGRLKGAAKQITYRSKFSDPLEAIMAVFVDDGNSERSRRGILRMNTGAHGVCGIAWGADGQDHFLVVVVAESFSDL
jgi:hypothetical protein